jgi:hypothetical protein
MGFKKALLCIGGLMLATGGPITMFSTSDLVGNVKRNWLANSAATAAATPQGSTTPTTPTPTIPASPAWPTGAAPDPTPIVTLAEALRFDVTVEWVMQRWPRVSTGLPHLQLQGYRVPLVTGTSVADVAGSLTYYFNARQQVQRITLRGATGDPTVLVNLLTSRYRLARRLTNDPGVVLYEAVDSSNRPIGSAKIHSANVIKANQPYTRFEVDVLLDRPE